MRKWALRLLRIAYVGLIASLPVAALGNYAATVGGATNFGSVIIGGVHFASMLFCDMTVANQCAAVSAGGAVKVDGSAVTQPVSQATAANLNMNATTGLNVGGANGIADSYTSPLDTAGGHHPYGVFPFLYNGTTWDRQPGDLTNGAFVNVKTSVLPTGAATSANQTTELASLASIVTNTGAAIPTGTNSIGSVNLAANVTATACSATVVTGNTAVNAFTAQTTLHGFTIANIDTAEVMWISFTTTAAASGTDSYPLAPATATTFAGLSSFTAPSGFGLNHALSVVAATNGHKFSCTWW